MQEFLGKSAERLVRDSKKYLKFLNLDASNIIL